MNITNNFLIENNSIKFSSLPILIKKQDIILHCDKNKIFVNNIQVIQSLIKIKDVTIYTCSRVPAGIMFSNNFDDFKLFGCLKNQIDPEYYSNLSQDLSTYFLGASGISLYKNYVDEYTPSQCLILKEEIDDALSILKTSDRNVN